MAGLAPRTIVLALGAGALGGPDALRLLLETAGRSPLHDILICVLAMAAVTAHVLGTTLLARFVRKPRAGGGGARATDLFACVTATVSVGAALLVTACLLAESGGLGALRLAFGFAAKNPVATVTVLVIGVGGFFPYTMPSLRSGRRAGTARGASPSADRATSQQTLSFVVPLLVAVCLLALVAPLFAPGAIDARWSLLAGVPVAVAAVVGAVVVARSPRRARDAAGAAAPAADTRRSAKLTQGTAAFLAVAVASLLVIPFAYAQPRWLCYTTVR
ncbi:hypothetical protein C2845_PM09G05880 [Panicum miliaceum]|uniref:Uncharacterized protein n=1 Tax=Panicum miliaceum TaxID=4540 RepID=A0A3L6RYM0_PANMI|nr:hypothetical protein C2845_PM09G05880 [Panicum miliaceum]